MSAPQDLERVVNRLGLVVGDAADQQRRAALRLVQGFHRRELGWLTLGHVFGAQVATQGLKQRCDRTHRERQAQPMLMEAAFL